MGSPQLVTWNRTADELARRIILTAPCPIDVPLDARGLLLQGGRILEQLEPGRHGGAAAAPSFFDFFRKKPDNEASSLVYVYMGGVTVETGWGQEGYTGMGALLSADNMPCLARARMEVRVEAPDQFVRQFLATGSDTVGTAQLALKIHEHFYAVVQEAVQRYSLLGATSGEALRRDLDQALLDNRPEFWRDRGLGLVRVGFTGVTSPQAREILNREAQLRYREQGLDQVEAGNKLARRERQAADLAEVLARQDSVGKMEMLADLDKRQANKTQEMAEFERQLRQKNLESQRDLDEKNEDYKLGRDHYKKRILALNDQDLEELARKYSRKVEIEDLQHGQQVGGIKRKGEIEDLEHGQQVTELSNKIEKEQVAHAQEVADLAKQGELKRMVAEAEAKSKARRFTIEDDALEGDMGLDILERTKRIAREDELEREAHRHKMLGELAKAGPMALIAGIDDAGRAALVGKLAEAEILKGMSEEQILARLAGGSPEIARVFQEKFKGSDLAKIESLHREMHGNQDKFRAELMDLFGLSATTQRDATVGVARAGGVAPVGVPSGTTGPAWGPPTAAPVTLLCPKCSTENLANANFCRNCGSKLRGG